MTTVNSSGESAPGRLWKIYDILERIMVGGVLGCGLTVPLLILTGLVSPELGPNGYAGDYAWYATVPLGMIIWVYLRRERRGGWLSRVVFGGACGALLATALFTGLKMAGYMVLFDTKEAVFGVYFWAILVLMVVWPIIMRMIYPRGALPGKNL